MANYSASDVMKLRGETDAPMMECKQALDEAGGDFEKAKTILREKGKAAAAKRADRSTAAGVVAFAGNADSTVVGGVVVECETDFVARNPDFIAVVQQIAELIRDGVSADDSKVKDLVEGAVAKIRENIKVTRSVRLEGATPIATYVHHDLTKGAAITFTGDVGTNMDGLKKVAIHAVAFPPEVVNKEELPMDKINAEIEVETQRAINEGKEANIARNIAQGRVNKEYIKRVVLLEQPFYADDKKSVGQYLSETAKGAKVAEFVYLAVGQGQEG